MQIDLVIESKFTRTAPVCNIKTSKKSMRVSCTQKINTIKLDLPMGQIDSLDIEFINKDDHDDNVIMVKKIFIDDIDLQHFIYKGEFRPMYNQDWFDKQQPKPPLVYKPCTELRHNGVWSIKIIQPIWKMMMEEWTNDDR